MKRAFVLANSHLLNHIGTIKFWAPFIIALSGTREAAQYLANMTAQYQIPVNGFISGLMFSDNLTVFMIFLGLYLILNDLPLKDSQQNFLLIRSGKKAWIFSQIIYIFYVILIYFSFVFAVFYIIQLPRLGFDANNWGKIARSTANPGFAQRIRVTETIQADYTPLEAFLCSVGMALFLALALAILMFTLNMLFKNKSGTVVTGISIFIINFMSMGAFGYVPYYFSPLCWCSLTVMDKHGTSKMPDFSYAVIVISAVILACATAMIIYGNKRSKFTL